MFSRLAKRFGNNPFISRKVKLLVFYFATDEGVIPETFR